MLACCIKSDARLCYGKLAAILAGACQFLASPCSVLAVGLLAAGTGWGLCKGQMSMSKHSAYFYFALGSLSLHYGKYGYSVKKQTD